MNGAKTVLEGTEWGGLGPFELVDWRCFLVEEEEGRETVVVRFLTGVVVMTGYEVGG